MNRVAALAVFLVLAGCSEQAPNSLQGYVEGDYVFVAAPQGGWISEVSVRQGQEVRSGDPLFVLDADAQIAARDRAKALAAQARAQYANLTKGRRPIELEASQAIVSDAQASTDLAATELERIEALALKGFATRKLLEGAQANAQSARSRLKNAQAQFETAKLGARPDEIAAAKAAIGAAEATLSEAQYAVSQRQIRARSAGRIEEILREKGEYAPAGAPVVQMLPPQNIKIRFFVPERLRSSVRVGQKAEFGCSGCPKGLSATVTFISSTAEYTPPVIYSIGARDKLVWMVEAKPDGAPAFLSPGQPVDVYRLVEAGPPVPALAFLK
jgi:HlyD family secretion protein